MALHHKKSQTMNNNKSTKWLKNIFDVWMKVIFEVKTSILHQFTELKASGGYFIPDRIHYGRLFIGSKLILVQHKYDVSVPRFGVTWCWKCKETCGWKTIDHGSAAGPLVPRVLDTIQQLNSLCSLQKHFDISLRFKQLTIKRWQGSHVKCYSTGDLPNNNSILQSKSGRSCVNTVKTGSNIDSELHPNMCLSLYMYILFEC